MTNIKNKPNVLIVDDENDDVLAIKDLVSATGLVGEVHGVLSGEASLAFVRKEEPFAQAPHIDLMILDLIMPGLSGYDVLRDMKADPELAGIHIIIVTGKFQDEVKAVVESIHPNIEIVPKDEFLVNPAQYLKNVLDA